MKRFLFITRLLQKRRGVLRTWTFFALLALLVPVSSAFALTPVSSCQDITVSGSYQLTADLANCGVVITANNVDFDLNGHAVSSISIYPTSTPSQDCFGTGYISDVTLRNGKAMSVGLVCAEKIRVTGVQILNTPAMYAISGAYVRNSMIDSNVITCIPATGYPNPDVTLGMLLNSSSNNQLFLNKISGCSYGIQLGAPTGPPYQFLSSDNQLLDNEVIKNGTGIFVSGNNNTFANNKVDQNISSISIYIGDGNLILSNDAKPGWLTDNSIDCGSNIWLNNIFQGATPCIH